MKFVSAEHDALMASQPAPDRTPACAPAGLPRDAGWADTCARSLDVLSRFGHGARRHERYLAARAEGCCYLCHAPLRAFLPGFPCPHWFVASASTVERVAPVFQTYALADMLHFLFTTLLADGPGRPRCAGWLAVLPGRSGIRLRLDRKLWSFSIDAAGAAPLLTIGLLNTRMNKHTSLQVPVSAEDAEVLRAVTALAGELESEVAVGDAASPRR